MDHSLYQRIGGAAGIDAVVHAFHQRVRNDPDIAASIDELRIRDIEDADAHVLTRALRGTPRDDRACLLVRRDVVDRHLRDALWLLGMSHALIDDVITAVVEAIDARAE